MAKQPKNPGVPKGRAPRRGEGPALVRDARAGGEKPKPGADLVERRHDDWKVNQICWRWLLDSYEGGQRYREAEYGPDRKGRPLRNLIRHKREYPDALEFPNTIQGQGGAAGAAAGIGIAAMMGPFPGMLGADPTATAQDDEYENRRARTTPQEFVKEVIEIHQGKIFAQTVSRKGPDDLMEWWKDVDGAGTPIDEWIEDVFAPLLGALGTLDLVFDRPYLPDSVRLETKQDEIDNNQNSVIAAYILPQNMLWWVNDPAGRYLECLVREYWSPTLRDRNGTNTSGADAQGWAAEFPGEPAPGDVRYRHWTATTVTLYDAEGEVVEATRPHGYDFVPILRCIDILRHRTPMIGKPRYELIAEYQRDYYNRDSELIIADSLQAHPSLSGPEDACKGDQAINFGPGWVLPKTRDSKGNYEPWEFVSPPKEPANSIRESLKQIREAVDRAACLTKPAGVTGTTGGTVSQSGYSKSMDAESGNKLLGKVAKSFARNERKIAEFALMCIRRAPLAPADRAAIEVLYPSRFQLKQGEQILGELERAVNVFAIEAQVAAMATGAQTEQDAAKTPEDQAGGNPAASKKKAPKDKPLQPGSFFAVPTLLAEMTVEYALATLGGRDDRVYDAIRAETMAFHHLHVLPKLGIASDSEAMKGHGSEEQMAGEDRTGRSSVTSVSPGISQVI